MDVIEVKVKGNYVTKDNKNAGTQGEANAKALRIEFDAGWDGCAKTINWWDAKGIFAVGRVLTADLLEDLKASTRIYLTQIPGEAMLEWGQCMFGIDGYINGKRKRSVYAKLVVKPGQGSIVLEEVTPSQIEQLQVQIDTLLSDIQAEANRAAAAASAAAKSEAAAEDAAGTAIENANQAGDYAAQAKGAQRAAEKAALDASNAADAAVAANTSAETAKTAAETAKSGAEAAAFTASQEREKAGIARSQAQTAENNAVSAMQAAIDVKNGTAKDKLAAEQAKTAAETAKTSAESAQKLAEQARDTAIEASKNGTGISLANQAAAGQLVMITKVDANGVPTKWKAIDRTHYKAVKYGEIYFNGPPSIEEPVPPTTIIGNAWDIMTTTHELEYILDGVSYVRQASRGHNGSKEYRFIGDGSLIGHGTINSDDFCLYVMYDESTHMTTIDAMYEDGTKPNEIFIKEQDEVVWKQLEPGYLPTGAGTVMHVVAAGVYNEEGYIAGYDLNVTYQEAMAQLKAGGVLDFWFHETGLDGTITCYQASALGTDGETIYVTDPNLDYNGNYHWTANSFRRPEV